MSYAVFPSGSEHRGILAKLWTENFNDKRVAELVKDRFEWCYQSAVPTSTWLVSHRESGEIVGCGSVFPRTIYVGGCKLKAGILGDFAFDKSHRVGGPAVSLQRAIATDCQELGFDLLYGYPNQNALPVLKRVGYRSVGAVSSWVKPVRTENKFREHLSGPMARVAAMFTDRLLAANDFCLRARLPRGLGNITPQRACGTFDELWERAKPLRRIVGERTSPYLNWRYGPHTVEQHKFFGLVETRTQRLRAYVAYHIYNNRGFIDDLLTDGAQLDELLVLRFVSHMRREGRASVFLSFLGEDAFKNSLRRLQFIEGELNRQLIIRTRPGLSPEIEGALNDPHNWFMLEGELDI